MQDVIYQDLPAEERRRVLNDSADMIMANSTYSRPLTEEELAIAREELASLAVQMQVLEEKRKEVMAQLKAEAEPVKQQYGTTLAALRDRHTHENGTLYGMIDYEERKVYFYSEAGYLVDKRLARPNELQTTIMRPLRKASGHPDFD